IVQVASLDPGPAQVIGNPVRFDARSKRPNSGKVFKIDGIGAADRERHAVHDEREALAYALQVVQRLAAGHQIVLRDDFEPVDGVRLVEHGLIMRGSEAQAKTGKFHGCRLCGQGPGVSLAPGPMTLSAIGLLGSGGLRLRFFAVGLRHGRPALALAAVHALATVLRPLALGHALTRIYTRTMDGCR